MRFELSQTEVDKLTEAARMYQELRQQIEKAKRAGLNVADLEAELDRQERIRAGLLREFRPSATP